MSHVYVLTNQHQQFLSKNSEWIDGRESARLFRSEHKDIAINQMFEANTRNVNLRIELLHCPLDSKAQPQVPETALGEAGVELGEPQREPQGAGEIEPGSPPELPPETAPEAEPQPAPEVEPEHAPEVDPNPQPEVTPEEPPEIRPGESDRLLTALEFEAG